MKALRENTYYLEASSPHANDVIRIEDDFNRINLIMISIIFPCFNEIENLKNLEILKISY